MRFNSTVEGEGPFEREDLSEKKAERGEPTDLLEAIDGPLCSRPFLLARFLRSFGEGVRLAGEVRGELRGLQKC